MSEYFTHYITIDGHGRIKYGWSDGPLRVLPKYEDALVHNDQGGYQFRLKFSDGSTTEENPQLQDENGVLLYALEGDFARRRTDDEIDADRRKTEFEVY